MEWLPENVAKISEILHYATLRINTLLPGYRPAAEVGLRQI